MDPCLDTGHPTAVATAAELQFAACLSTRGCRMAQLAQSFPAGCCWLLAAAGASLGRTTRALWGDRDWCFGADARETAAAAGSDLLDPRCLQGPTRKPALRAGRSETQASTLLSYLVSKTCR